MRASEKSVVKWIYREASGSHCPCLIQVFFFGTGKDEPDWLGWAGPGVYFLVFMCWLTTTPTIMATTMRMIRMMKKQIHRFFLAARAESTAFSVC